MTLFIQRLTKSLFDHFMITSLDDHRSSFYNFYQMAVTLYLECGHVFGCGSSGPTQGRLLGQTDPMHSTSLYSNVMYSTVMYSTLMYSSVLFCTAFHFTVLYCTLLYSTVMNSTILYGTVLYCTELYYTIHYILLYWTQLYCTLLYSPVLCNTLLYLWSAAFVGQLLNRVKRLF